MSLSNSPEFLESKKWFHFLAPRYWGMWLAFALLWLIIQLPTPGIRCIGFILGSLFQYIIPRRRRFAAINLRLCFPELSERARENLLHQHFQSVGLGLLEAALAWWASDARIKKMVQEVEGLDPVFTAQQQGLGALVATAHFTNIELGIRMLNLYCPCKLMYRPQNNALFEWMLLRARRHYTTGLITRYDARGLLRSLKQGDVICYTPDQDYGSKSSVFAPFFGVPAATVDATRVFIEHSGAKIVVGSYVRSPWKMMYSLKATAPLTDYPSEDALKDTVRLNQCFEKIIRTVPEQYMWTHRRFKTRPEGSASFYD